jgi:hypothetical protein
MAWVAFDRAVKDVERSGSTARRPLARAARRDARRDLRGASTPSATPSCSPTAQTELDASLLMMPRGGLPARDRPAHPRHGRGHRARLMRDGFVDRYRTESGVDGLPPGEGAFLLCTFWLADNYALLGRTTRPARGLRAPAGHAQRRGPARRGVRPGAPAAAGQLPQAFSHLGLINTARNLARAPGRRGPRRGLAGSSRRRQTQVADRSTTTVRRKRPRTSRPGCTPRRRCSARAVRRAQARFRSRQDLGRGPRRPRREERGRRPGAEVRQSGDALRRVERGAGPDRVDNAGRNALHLALARASGDAAHAPLSAPPDGRAGTRGPVSACRPDSQSPHQPTSRWESVRRQQKERLPLEVQVRIQSQVGYR